MRELILGGVKSGKSRYAEQQALASDLPVTLVATAQAGDAEMAARIAAHQAARPASWRTVESPLELAQCLLRLNDPKQCVLVDCLTLWLTNVLLKHADLAAQQAACDALLDAVQGFNGRLLLVSNETNLGIIPVDALSRRFCDLAGRLHQDLGQICQRVVLVVAGIPLAVKENP